MAPCSDYIILGWELLACCLVLAQGLILHVCCKRGLVAPPGAARTHSIGTSIRAALGAKGQLTRLQTTAGYGRCSIHSAARPVDLCLRTWSRLNLGLQIQASVGPRLTEVHIGWDNAATDDRVGPHQQPSPEIQQPWF